MNYISSIKLLENDEEKRPQGHGKLLQELL